MLVIKSNGNTDVGMVRSNNQDSYLANNNMGLFVVADGMGGHVGGEIASSLCVSEISEYVKNNILNVKENNKDNKDNKDNRENIKNNKSTDKDMGILYQLINAVNNASCKIYERALEEPQLKGMGTTASVLQIIGDKAYIAHVGDSRIYLIRANFIYQLTNDHSFVNEQVRAGLLTEEEAKYHHARNIITRSVGYQEEEEVDIKTITLEDQDLLLMCSDGLHGKLSDEEISNITSKEELNAVDTLIRIANERGGNDNVTVVIVKMEEQSN